VLHAPRRAFARAAGGEDIAVKVITCLTEKTKDEVKHELEAMRKVADLELDGCMPGGEAYVKLLSWKGGLKYHLTMPCAFWPVDILHCFCTSCSANVPAMDTVCVGVSVQALGAIAFGHSKSRFV